MTRTRTQRKQQRRARYAEIIERQEGPKLAQIPALVASRSLSGLITFRQTYRTIDTMCALFQAVTEADWVEGLQYLLEYDRDHFWFVAVRTMIGQPNHWSERVAQELFSFRSERLIDHLLGECASLRAVQWILQYTQVPPRPEVVTLFLDQHEYHYADVVARASCCPEALTQVADFKRRLHRIVGLYLLKNVAALVVQY